MFRHLLLNTLCLILLANCTNGVHLVHSNTDDFQSYTNIQRYTQKQSSCKSFRFSDKKDCPCVMEKLNEMALVYFDRFAKKNGQEVPERYLVSQTKLGSGGYSKTYHATPITDKNKRQKCVAIKIAAKSLETDGRAHGIAELKKEAVVLSDLSKSNNKHIIKLKEILMYEDGHGTEKIAILMELGGLDLSGYARLIMGNAINGYIYFDLKPSNMLIMPHYRSPGEMHKVYLKFIDFAGAQKVPEDGKLNGRFITTEVYAAPEWVKEKDIGKAFDIWSLGISILDLLSYTEIYKKYENDDVYIIEAYKEGKKRNDHEWIRKRKPYEKRDKLLSTLSLKMIAQNRPDDFEKIAPLLRELDGRFPNSMRIIRDCLKVDPAERPIIKELLTRHEEIFEDIDLTPFYEQPSLKPTWFLSKFGKSIAETSGTSSSLNITEETILQRMAERIQENRNQRGSTSGAGASSSGNVADYEQNSPLHRTPIGTPFIQTAPGTPTGHGRSTSRVQKFRSFIAKSEKSVRKLVVRKLTKPFESAVQMPTEENDALLS